MKRFLSIFLALCFSVALSACGGGGGGGSSTGASSTGAGSTSNGSTGTGATSGGTTTSSNPTPTPTPSTLANQVPVTLGDGTFATFNRAYVSVTVCVPGTSTCQTVDHVIIDTGSSGLRLFAGALNSTMLAALPFEPSSGQHLQECAMFAGGSMWGSVRNADIQMAGETAPGAPVQIVNDGDATVPSNCSSSGTLLTTPNSLGGNGLIGIDALERDCGVYCATNAGSGYYWTCAGSTCTSVSAPTSAQVGNPVAQFAYDNNGAVLTLPTVAPSGQVVATGGVLSFGVDTQADNMLSGLNLQLYTLSTNLTVNATYKSTAMPAFFDTGSAAYYFDDSSIPQCTAYSISGVYCPSPEDSLSVSLAGANGTASNYPFTLRDGQTDLTASPQNYVFPDLGLSTGSGGTVGISGNFDMGLPFFMGRSTAVLITAKPSYEGTGPAVAF